MSKLKYKLLSVEKFLELKKTSDVKTFEETIKNHIWVLFDNLSVYYLKKDEWLIYLKTQNKDYKEFDKETYEERNERLRKKNWAEYKKELNAYNKAERKKEELKKLERLEKEIYKPKTQMSIWDIKGVISG